MTTTTTTTDLTTVIDTYFKIWNETDAGARARLIPEAWSKDCSYVDPLQEAAGPEGISTMVDGVHAQFPGHRFRQVDGIDAHHDTVRFTWELVGAEGNVVVKGLDVAELDPSGRLRKVIGFLGDIPAA